MNTRKSEEFWSRVNAGGSLEQASSSVISELHPMDDAWLIAAFSEDVDLENDCVEAALELVEWDDQAAARMRARQTYPVLRAGVELSAEDRFLVQTAVAAVALNDVESGIRDRAVSNDPPLPENSVPRKRLIMTSLGAGGFAVFACALAALLFIAPHEVARVDPSVAVAGAASSSAVTALGRSSQIGEHEPRQEIEHSTLQANFGDLRGTLTGFLTNPASIGSSAKHEPNLEPLNAPPDSFAGMILRPWVLGPSVALEGYGNYDELLAVVDDTSNFSGERSISDHVAALEARESRLIANLQTVRVAPFSPSSDLWIPVGGGISMSAPRWSENSFTMVVIGFSDASMLGTVGMTALPDPGSWAGWGAALLVFGLTSRRRRRDSCRNEACANLSAQVEA